MLTVFFANVNGNVRRANAGQTNFNKHVRKLHEEVEGKKAVRFQENSYVKRK